MILSFKTVLPQHVAKRQLEVWNVTNVCLFIISCLHFSPSIATICRDNVLVQGKVGTGNVLLCSPSIRVGYDDLEWPWKAGRKGSDFSGAESSVLRFSGFCPIYTYMVWPGKSNLVWQHILGEVCFGCHHAKIRRESVSEIWVSCSACLPRIIQMYIGHQVNTLKTTINEWSRIFLSRIKHVYTGSSFVLTVNSILKTKRSILITILTPKLCENTWSKGIWLLTRKTAIANKPLDAFRGQSRSPNMVPFHMLGIVSY